MTSGMRTPEEQKAGLVRVAVKAQVLDAKLVEPQGYLDVIALRKNNVEIVYAAGGYDLWTPGGGSMVAHDLSLEQAVEELRRA